MKKFADIITDVIKIAKKHNIPETRLLYWVFLENLANEMMMILYKDFGENFISALKDWALVTEQPLTSSQLKTYRDRLEAYMKTLNEGRKN